MKTKSTAFTLGFLSFVSMLTIMMGLGLCITKTPQQKSAAYVTIANQYMKQASNAYLTAETQTYLRVNAQQLIKQSLAKNPYNADAWQGLASVSSSPKVTFQAKIIASKLNDKDHNETVANGLLPAKNIALMGYNNNNLIR